MREIAAAWSAWKSRAALTAKANAGWCNECTPENCMGCATTSSQAAQSVPADWRDKVKEITEAYRGTEHGKVAEGICDALLNALAAAPAQAQIGLELAGVKTDFMSRVDALLAEYGFDGSDGVALVRAAESLPAATAAPAQAQQAAEKTIQNFTLNDAMTHADYPGAPGALAVWAYHLAAERAGVKIDDQTKKN